MFAFCYGKSKAPGPDETISKVRQILANRLSIADLFGPHLAI
jgi:hypothetical protein